MTACLIELLVKFCELGVPTNCVLEKAPAWGNGVRKPIVFYGTSILQGASDVLMQPFDRDLLQFKLRQAGVIT